MKLDSATAGAGLGEGDGTGDGRFSPGLGDGNATAGLGLGKLVGAFGLGVGDGVCPWQAAATSPRLSAAASRRTVVKRGCCKVPCSMRLIVCCVVPARCASSP